MDPSARRPSPAEIRRALAECMTLGDIDDAMEWASGSARRLRWEEPELGGLPPADAALGGTPVWFRASISAWRVTWAELGLAGRRRDPTDDGSVAVAEPDDEVTAESELEPEPDLEVEREHEAELEPGVGAGPEPERDQQDGELAPECDLHNSGPALRDEADNATTDHDDVPPSPSTPSRVYGTDHDTPPPGSTPVTGTGELDADQPVIAWASRAWRDAHVVSHSRTSVVVTYRLGRDRLGDRVTRLELTELRHPAAD